MPYLFAPVTWHEGEAQLVAMTAVQPLGVVFQVAQRWLLDQDDVACAIKETCVYRCVKKIAMPS
jgi:hypothetical protein